MGVSVWNGTWDHALQVTLWASDAPSLAPPALNKIRKNYESILRPL